MSDPLREEFEAKYGRRRDCLGSSQWWDDCLEVFAAGFQAARASAPAAPPPTVPVAYMIIGRDPMGDLPPRLVLAKHYTPRPDWNETVTPLGPIAAPLPMAAGQGEPPVASRERKHPLDLSPENSAKLAEEWNKAIRERCCESCPVLSAEPSANQGVTPVGFVRPDEGSPGRHVFVNFHEGRNTALPWRPVYAAPVEGVLRMALEAMEAINDDFGRVYTLYMHPTLSKSLVPIRQLRIALGMPPKENNDAER